jgi:hypothetical protein
VHTDEKNRKDIEIMFLELGVQDQFGDRATDGGNSKNESLGNGFRRYQSNSIISAYVSAYDFCAGGDKKLCYMTKWTFLNLDSSR